MKNDAGSETQESVHATHVGGVAAGEVIVDRNDVNAFASQCVEVTWESRNERFAFTGSHFRHSATVKSDATDHLNVVMPEPDRAPGCFANDSKGFGQKLVDRLTFGEPF